MVNGVNINDELNNAKLSEQSGISGITTNLASNAYRNVDKNLLIDETAVSNEAITLYEKEQDVKKFNILALSNPEDLSHEEIVEGLFNKGFSDPLSDESAAKLSSNKRLLGDLGL